MKKIILTILLVMMLGIARIAFSFEDPEITTTAYPMYVDGRSENLATPFAVHVTISNWIFVAGSDAKVRVTTTSGAHLSIWNGTAWGTASTYDNAPTVSIDGSGNWSGWIYVKSRSSVGSIKAYARNLEETETLLEETSYSLTYMDMSTAGAWIHATAVSATAGKAVLAFNSSEEIIGTYAIENNNVGDGYPSTSGYFKMAVPAGTSIPKLQARNSDNSVYNTQTNNWQSGNVGSDIDLDTQQDVTLPVTLSSFAAIPTDSGVILKWRTESEVDNLGWDIYRSEKKNGKFVKINDGLIPGAGNSAMPNTYQFVDKTAIKGRQYYYYLEDVDIAGMNNKSSIIPISKDAGKLTTTWSKIKKG